MPTVRPWRLVPFAAALAALALVVAAFSTQPLVAGRAGGAATAAADLETVDPAAVGLSAERLERLDAGLQAMVDDGRLAGTVALLARHGKIAFVDVAGVQDIESGRPMARDSIFRIFSMTKPITGVAMMMLYEEGKWRLNDPVSRYIPELAGLQVYAGENDDGSMKLVDADNEMTMRELMTHTAGLGYVLNPRHPVNRLFMEKRVLNPLEPLAAMIDKLAAVPLLAQPGTRWIYSAAVDVQGYLVEKLSGQPFAEFLDERIFEPLGMVDTGFYVPPSEVHRVALRHTAGEDGDLVLDSRGDPFTSPPAGPSGGGGLYGTADDYIRFTQMLLNGGELDGRRLLSPRTVEMMHTNHMSAEATAHMRPGMGFGMDFMIYDDPAAAGEPHAPGAYYWLGIDGTWFWIDPALELAFVGMIQHRGEAQGRVHGLSRNWVYQAIVD
ncbi:MAG: serine hydrolase [Acidobacteria bacterium]|nr:serine hydrolase [Acidobacteriota bacterium]